MSVRTNYLLLRKNYTISKFFFIRYKLLFILLRLQVKSIISSFFMFPKKRFLFMQSIKKFNCFNQIIGNVTFLSVYGRSHLFFFFRAKKNLNFFNKKKDSAYRAISQSSAINMCRKRFNFYIQQLFYIFINRQRSFYRLVFGVLPRYLRYARIMRIYSLSSMLRKSFFRFNRFIYLLKSSNMLFREVYSSACKLKQLTTPRHLKLIKQLLYRSFNSLQSAHEISSRFFPFISVESAINAFHLKRSKNVIYSNLFKYVNNKGFSKRRRLLFFSGKVRIVALLFLNVFLYLTLGNTFIYELFSIDFVINNVGYWFYICYNKNCFVLREMEVFYRSTNLKVPAYALLFMQKSSNYLYRGMNNNLLGHWQRFWFSFWRAILYKILFKRFRIFRFAWKKPIVAKIWKNRRFPMFLNGKKMLPVRKVMVPYKKRFICIKKEGKSAKLIKNKKVFKSDKAVSLNKNKFTRVKKDEKSVKPLKTKRVFNTKRALSLNKNIRVKKDGKSAKLIKNKKVFKSGSVARLDKNKIIRVKKDGKSVKLIRDKKVSKLAKVAQLDKNKVRKDQLFNRHIKHKKAVFVKKKHTRIVDWRYLVNIRRFRLLLRIKGRAVRSCKRYLYKYHLLRTYWSLLKKDWFKHYRLKRLVYYFKNLRGFMLHFGLKHRFIRYSNFLSWDVYMDFLNFYNKPISLKMNWFLYYPIIKKFINKRRFLTIKSFRGSAARLLAFYFRTNYQLYVKKRINNVFLQQGYYNVFLKRKVLFFLLPLQKFKRLFFANHTYGKTVIFKDAFRYKFYINYLKRCKTSFYDRKNRVWSESNLTFFQKTRRFFRSKLRRRFFGYRRVLGHLRFLHASFNLSLTFYSLFKRRLGRKSFDVFFTRGVDFFIGNFRRKLRYIKRKLIITTFKIFYWNKTIMSQVTLIKMKRKPFSIVKIQRLSVFARIKIQLQKYKLYSRLYFILLKFLLSFRLTGAWLNLRGLVIFFNVNHVFLFNRNRLRRLLNLVRNSFYLRYYKNKATFLNSLLLTIISMYYRSPEMLNSAFCNAIRGMWKHRVHIFDTFKLITAVLWRNSFKRTSSFLHVKTVYMQINGKINSGTRTKHFKMRVDYKPAFLTLQNSLSFCASTADPRTGIFGVQTWYSY